MNRILNGLRSGATAAILVAIVSLGLPAAELRADETHKHAAAPATNALFERLKSLAGMWTANTMTADGDTTLVEYRVTGAGSAVMERMFVGEPHEMINMYTVDGDAVLAMHYCSAGNQPTLRLNAAKSKENEYVFDFVSVRGKETAYINSVKYIFHKDGKVEEHWGSSTGDKDLVKLYLNSRQP